MTTTETYSTEIALTPGGPVEERSWLTTAQTVVPSAGKSPLIIELHAFYGNPDEMEYTGWTDIAKEVGAIIVHPTGYNNSWNVLPGMAGDAADIGVDDLSFLDEVLSRTRGQYEISDVYITGHSNGCAMAQKYAFYRSGDVNGMSCDSLYTGIDAISQHIPGVTLPDEASYKPFPVIEIHGVNDEIIPYDLRNYPDDYFRLVGGAKANMKRWAERNKCNPTPTETTCKGGDGGYNTTVYDGCANGKNVLISVLDGYQAGHTPQYYPCLGNETDASKCIDTTRLAWNFLRTGGEQVDCEPVEEPTVDPPTVIDAGSSAPTVDPPTVIDAGSSAPTVDPTAYPPTVIDAGSSASREAVATLMTMVMAGLAQLSL